MIRRRKNKIITLITILVISTLISTSASKVSAISNSTYDEPFILMEYSPNEVSFVHSASIIDNNSRVHFFLLINYYNGSFVILHIVDDEINIVETGRFAGYIFQVYKFGNNVSLIYNLESQVYRNIVKMYNWNENTGHSTTTLYTSNVESYLTKIVMEEDVIHILSKEHYYGEPPRLEIDHVKVFLNGSVVEEHSVLFIVVEESELFIVDGQLYAYIKSLKYNSTFGYYDKTSLIIAGVTDSGYYNSTVYVVDDTWFSSQVSVSSDGKFYLSYVSYGILYTAKFDVNETLTPSSFKELYFGAYYFYGQFDVFSYTNNTYLVYPEQTYYWLEYSPYYYDPYQKVKTLKLYIITDNNVSLTQENVLLEDYPTEYQFSSVSYNIIENGSYSILYSNILESASFEDMRFLSDYVFAWKALSDLKMNLPSDPILYGIKSVSSFAYFWIKYWYTVVSPILVLSLIYVIFRKRINRGIKKMIRFLTRPIIPNAKKAKLVVVNFWLFVKNAFSLIFILWKANKRRLVISLVGLTILSTIIVTSTTLFDSKRNSLITNYVDSADLYNNDYLSIYYNLNLGNYFGVENDPVNPNITEYAFSEILHTISTRTTVVRNIIRDYYYSLSTNLLSLNYTAYGTEPLTARYYGLQENYSEIIDELLTEGRIPEQRNEVIISSGFQESENIHIDDIISFNTSSIFEIDTNKTHSLNLTVVGVYQEPSDNLLNNLCVEYSLPSDPINGLKVYRGLPTALTFTSHYFHNLENITVYHLTLNTDIQFTYDFSRIDVDLLNILLEETQKLTSESPYTFNFLPGSTWYFLDELQGIFSGISAQMQMTQFIVVFLSIPILYLALFITFEVNELFSSSFEQEIRIMSSKGVSTGMITFLYSTMKFFEALVATFLGLAVNLAILPPLLKVDSFISFKAVFTSIELGTAPASMGITLLLLIGIALPKIIKLSKTKHEVEKPPKKFVQLMKNIRLPYFLLIAFGGGLIGLGYWLLTSSFYSIYLDPSLTLVTIYIYIIGIGIMISLLGVGLLLRELHKIFMIAISKASWLIKKNFFTFSLVQIRSDIKLFNNTFLTYVILVGILIPFTMTPLLIQDKVNTQTYFYGGSDLIISSWEKYNDSVVKSFSNYSEIVSYTNITHLIATYRDYTIEFLIINDTDDYLKTSFKPPDYLVENWDESIASLGDNTSMLASSQFKEYVAGGDSDFNFVNESASEPTIVPFTIESSFDYFPVFFDYGPPDYYSYYDDYYYPEPIYSTFGIVMSQKNFDYIFPLLSIENIVLQRLLINVKNSVDQEKFADELSQDLGIEILTMDTASSLLIFTLFPFYSVLVAEFVFGILICFAAVAFTSLSNPLKILQKRLVKHDILKKIGIPTNRIILLSALELFISCIVPGLILGGAAGYGLLRLFNWLFIDSMSTYGGLPFQIFFPYQVILTIFVAIPVVFYSIFFIAMKYNFAKYIPKNLE